MKKLLLVFFTLPLIHFSCEKEDDTSLTNNTSENPECETVYIKDESEVSSIIGKTYTFRTNSEACDSFAICQNDFPIQFTSDSTLSVKSIDVFQILSYEKNEDSIHITNIDDSISSYVLSTDSSELISSDGSVYIREIAISTCE